MIHNAHALVNFIQILKIKLFTYIKSGECEILSVISLYHANFQCDNGQT